MTDYTFGILVKFKQREGWSKAYAYSFYEALEIDSLVIVENSDNFYSVARVKQCIPNYNFSPSINYKQILQVLDFNFEEPDAKLKKRRVAKPDLGNVVLSKASEVRDPNAKSDNAASWLNNKIL
jgi:hypothetical protein